MGGSRLSLLALAPAFVGCAGTVSATTPGGDAETTTTSAIIVVERNIDPTGTGHAQTSARFLRVPSSLPTDEALRSIGAALDLPARGTCASSTPAPDDVNSDERPPFVDLVDVGTVSVEADGTETHLLPRRLPDVTDIVSGVVYARAADPGILPPATRYVLHVGGLGDLPAIDVMATAPADASDVHFSGEMTPGVLVATSGIEVSWPAEAAAESIYVDVKPAGLRCTLGDASAGGTLGHASLSSSLFDDAGTLVVHRLHREPLQALGLTAGEIRFDFARTLTYVRH
ncbi:MAG: hypothetical protein ABSC94_23195 [Polyangiaceae bacterium]|jgi:hypothetical protein